MAMDTKLTTQRFTVPLVGGVILTTRGNEAGELYMTGEGRATRGRRLAVGLAWCEWPVEIAAPVALRLVSGASSGR